MMSHGASKNLWHANGLPMAIGPPRTSPRSLADFEEVRKRGSARPSVLKTFQRRIAQFDKKTRYNITAVRGTGSEVGREIAR